MKDATCRSNAANFACLAKELLTESTLLHFGHTMRAKSQSLTNLMKSLLKRL